MRARIILFITLLLVVLSAAWGQAPLVEISSSRATAQPAVAGLSLGGSTRDTAFNLPRVTNNAFLPGEKLTYVLRYGWFTAGEATFSVEIDQPIVNNRRTYHLRGTGKTVSAFEWFYTVRDEFDTWVDQDALLPYRYVRKVHEGKTKFVDEVKFDHQTGVISGGKGTFTAQSLTFDLVSALYYSRCSDLRTTPVGQFVNVPVFLDDKIYPLGFKVLGRETVRIGYGKFRCLVITPKVVTGTLFTDKDNLKIWVTDDENQIPIKIYSPLVVGNVNAELVSFANLRNPIAAAVFD
jgi:Protein of unknown function (DUF3108)